MKAEATSSYERARETAEFLQKDCGAKISQEKFVDLYLSGVLKARRDPRKIFSNKFFLAELEN
jgi:hypothetical protein